MRQEHKEEAAVLVQRLAEASLARRDGTEFYLQLIELVNTVARTLPAPRDA